MRKAAIVAVLLVIAGVAVGQQPQPPAGAIRVGIESKVLGEGRSVLVRTPPGYANSSARYPVLYMTDGDAHLGHTAATLDFLAQHGRMPQMIIVGISNTDRTRDLTPTRGSLETRFGRQAFPTAGGADKFLQFIETELIPFIEANYRTQPYRVFSGHSFGGLFAIHSLYSKPDLFNAVIAASPTLNWDEQLLIRRGHEFFKDRKQLKSTMYLTIGNEGEKLDEAFNTYRALLREVKAKGFVWAAQRLDDDDHGSVVLPTQYAGFRRIFEGWQVPRDPETGAILAGWSGVKSHYRRLSDRVGYTVVVPEQIANFMGYQTMNAGDMEEAIEIFRWNVEHYPESANVYDSLAEAYEKSGKLELARENYARAAELGKKNNDPNQPVYQRNFERVAELTK